MVEVDWEQIARTRLHPRKIRILEHAAASPEGRFSAKELADAFEEPLEKLSGHVRELHAAGLIVKAGTTPRRGALQRHYRIASNALR